MGETTNQHTNSCKIQSKGLIYFWAKIKKYGENCYKTVSIMEYNLKNCEFPIYKHHMLCYYMDIRYSKTTNGRLDPEGQGRAK